MSSGKSTPWYKRILVTVIPVVIFVLLIIVAINSLSSSFGSGGAETSARTQSDSMRKGGGAATASPQAASNALNTMCAAYSLAPQHCTLKPFVHGQGYIGFVRDAPDHARMCTSLADDLPSTPVEKRVIKETWYLLTDGKEVKVEPGQAKPENIFAIETIPTQEVSFVYYLAESDCKMVPS